MIKESNQLLEIRERAYNWLIAKCKETPDMLAFAASIEWKLVSKIYYNSFMIPATKYRD